MSGLFGYLFQWAFDPDGYAEQRRAEMELRVKMAFNQRISEASLREINFELLPESKQTVFYMVVERRPWNLTAGKYAPPFREDRWIYATVPKATLMSRFFEGEMRLAKITQIGATSALRLEC